MSEDRKYAHNDNAVMIVPKDVKVKSDEDKNIDMNSVKMKLMGHVQNSEPKV